MAKSTAIFTSFVFRMCLFSNKSKNTTRIQKLSIATYPPLIQLIAAAGRGDSMLFLMWQR